MASQITSKSRMASASSFETSGRQPFHPVPIRKESPHQQRHQSSPHQQRHHSQQSRENPTNVRSAHRLIVTMKDLVDRDRSMLALIPPHNQIIFIDCRWYTVDEFRGHLHVLDEPYHPNKWFLHTMIGELRLHHIPTPQEIAQIIISPGVIALWSLFGGLGTSSPELADTTIGSSDTELDTSRNGAYMTTAGAEGQESKASSETIKASLSHSSAPSAHSPHSLLAEDFVYLLIVQGADGAMTQKFILASSIDQGLTSVFFEAANGYSVVFIGAMLKSEYETRLVLGPGHSGRPFKLCRHVQELFELRDAQKVVLQDGINIDKRPLGILC